MTLVVAGVIVKRGAGAPQILACRRHRPAALAGRWEFPGGKTEPGEDPASALRRELREELALDDVDVGAELPAPEGGWPIGPDLHLRAWLARTAAEPVPGETHDCCRWLGPDEWDRVEWLPVDAAVVAALRSVLLSTDSARIGVPGGPSV